jgi:hypothetical protein
MIAPDEQVMAVRGWNLKFQVEVPQTMRRLKRTPIVGTGSLRILTTVYVQRGSGDVGRFWPRKERDGCSNVFWLAVTS